MRRILSFFAFVALILLTGCGAGNGGTPDTTPPILVSYSPLANATAIDHEISVDVFFNEAINHASINSSSFSLRDSANALVSGSYQLIDDGIFFRVRFIPAAPLDGDSMYQVAINTAISDLAGNHLAAALSWSFTTAPAGTGSWAPISTTNAPSARASHTAVWTGSEMLVWGGTSATSEGYRYQSATDTWTPMSTTNAPSPRWGHTAVWTGSEMIIWGGRVGTAYTWLNDGARYNPVTDTWQALMLSNAPEARAEHTAVWTGSEMIIWGGRNGGFFAEYPQAGGRYDPSTDTWQSMALVDAPSGRTGHAAAWSGSELIIWGGRYSITSDFLYLASGRRYNPATNTWSPVSTDNAPSARALLSGVWTGSEMIVWGGFDGSQYFNSGARYDPLADNWLPTAQDDAVLARWGHSAVWTGNYMIIWGGNTGRLGGIYDPASNTWGYTATLNAPSGRTSHSALWTGSDMLIWGGISGTATDSGGKYTP
jgi:N-acetylneuraminic acid mutarotase